MMHIQWKAQFGKCTLYCTTCIGSLIFKCHGYRLLNRLLEASSNGLYTLKVVAVVEVVP